MSLFASVIEGTQIRHNSACHTHLNVLTVDSKLATLSFKAAFHCNAKIGLQTLKSSCYFAAALMYF